jgi:hypothetical protein
VRKYWLAILTAFFAVEGPSVGLTEDKPPLVYISPTPENEAWWLRTQYYPFGTDIRGIPAANIRRGWCKVNELRRDVFPAEITAAFDDEQLSFAVDGFFDGSKTRQTALIGVYEACKGERGMFLLIVAWPAGKPPLIRHLVEMPGANQFGVVSASKDGTITLMHCLDCDHASEYKWNKSKRRFVLLPPSNED